MANDGAEDRERERERDVLRTGSFEQRVDADCLAVLVAGNALIQSVMARLQLHDLYL